MSVLDPIALALAVVQRRRAMRFLAAVEFFRHPVWGPALRIMKQVPIRRGARDQAALEEVGKFLREGGVAGIFPEGRVGDGTLPLKGHSGMARLAVAAGVPVIPAAVWGTQVRWPQGRLRFLPLRRLPVAVSFGEPILPAVNHNPGRVDFQSLTRSIMAAIEEEVRSAQALAER